MEEKLKLKVIEDLTKALKHDEPVPNYNFIPFKTCCKMLNLTPEVVSEMIWKGKVRAVVTPEGYILIPKDEVSKLAKMKREVLTEAVGKIKSVVNFLRIAVSIVEVLVESGSSVTVKELHEKLTKAGLSISQRYLREVLAKGDGTYWTVSKETRPYKVHLKLEGIERLRRVVEVLYH